MLRLAPVVAVALTALAPSLAGGGGVAPPRQISSDPFTDAIGQHETAVEPDSVSFGNTVVATFQVGRMTTGGASGIGWATSTDGGATWRSGVLPLLTVHGSPPGRFTRASDPTVAYDRAHGVWLISVLAIRDVGDEVVSSLVVSRSSDGLSWSPPVTVSPEIGRGAHDKNWIGCDSGAASPRAGRCYVAWTHTADLRSELAVAASSDGGLTWAAPTIARQSRGLGFMPVVRPDGLLVVIYWGEPGVSATRSTDGGASFSAPVRVGRLRWHENRALRAPPLPSAEVDAGGRITVAWPDCGYRSGCPSNDVVVASSLDGVRWSRAVRVPTGAELDGLDHVLTGLAVDATTRGASARLALAFYVTRPRGCGADCALEARFVSSADGGRRWSAAEELSAPVPLGSFPLAGRRFPGDYISTSFVAGGVAVPVFASASAAFDGRYHQGVFATAVPPLPAVTPTLRLGAAKAAPARPRARQRVTVAAAVLGAIGPARASCTARAGRARLPVLARRVAAGRASCVLRVPAGAGGKRLVGSIAVATPEADATRRFSVRVRG
jgi:hypothetical protein